MDNLLSIIVPVYNTEKYLKYCVQSLLDQTYSNKEIVLVDDGSTDSSSQICDSLSKQYSIVKTIHKKNGGLISAWSTGVKQCNGDFVGFVDSDDYLDKDYYAVLMKPINDLLCDVSMCGFSLEGEIIKKVTAASDVDTGFYEGKKIEYIKNNYFNEVNIQNSRCLKVYRKQVILDNLKYIDESIMLGEDMTITVPAILDSKRIYINQNYFGYHYLIQTSSMSHSLKDGQVDNFFKLYRLVSREFGEKGFMNEYVHLEFKKQLLAVVGLIIFSAEKQTKKIKLLKKLRSDECVDYLINISSKKLKKSWRILNCFFKCRNYRLLCCLGKIKELYNRRCIINDLANKRCNKKQ